MQGEEGREFYVVAEGNFEVRIRKEIAPSDAGEDDGSAGATIIDPLAVALNEAGGRVVHSYGPGSHFGELALM